jgi:hypothetical protein
MIVVINKKWIRFRRPEGLAPDAQVIYVGRPSPLGNPYRVGQHGTREEIIARYEKWLGTTDAALRELIRLNEMDKAGRDLVLACWCAPLPCHADVIKKVIEEWPDEPAGPV